MKDTERAGFGGLDIQRTPMGTRISLFIERPGLVIGRGGESIKRLTETLEKDFEFDNPQIEVQDVDNPSQNANIMAEKLAVALERGWHFRRAGHSTVRRIMDSGARGCQVVISGKLTGQRHRTEKFKTGHIKHCGEPKMEFMRDGFAIAKLKAGVIGVKVQIMDPTSRLPDDIEVKAAAAPAEAEGAVKAEGVAVEGEGAVAGPEAEGAPVEAGEAPVAEKAGEAPLVEAEETAPIEAAKDVGVEEKAEVAPGVAEVVTVKAEPEVAPAAEKEAVVQEKAEVPPEPVKAPTKAEEKKLAKELKKKEKQEKADKKAKEKAAKKAKETKPKKVKKTVKKTTKNTEVAEADTAAEEKEESE
ncbi:MAG: 30S ribosomal protein S3, partial [Thermoplasmata archaeon]|nr:30S ribosomal protein S3 [Thermoplasmata archaeon]